MGKDLVSSWGSAQSLAFPRVETECLSGLLGEQPLPSVSTNHLRVSADAKRVIVIARSTLPSVQGIPLPWS
jgi:hypothetical protein